MQATSLESALRQFQAEARPRGRAGEPDLAVCLPAYLSDYAGLERVGELAPAHVWEFLLEWAPSALGLEAAEHVALTRRMRAFVDWLAGAAGIETLAGLADRLRALERDLGRCHQLVERFAVAREAEELSRPVTGVSEADEAPVAVLSGGAQRLVDLTRVDYAAAEADYFRVSRVEGQSAFLYTPERRQLGEADLGPVRLPAGAAELLRPDDILKLEVAPAASGWEILDVESVRPGGYE